MRRWLLLVPLLALATPSVRAVDLATTCHATSSYDLTLSPQGVLFDRPAPAPTRVEVHDGQLRVDGVAVRVTPSEEDRLTLFERDLRALVPRVRAVADHGVDAATAALRAEVAGLALDADARAEFDRRLATATADAKQRIAASNTTHDWSGDAGATFAAQLVADLAPVVAGDLGQQALQAALAGDIDAAATLRDRAADLATGLTPRLRQRLDGLRPEIAALCPAIRRLAELQDGVRGSDGKPLQLLEIER